jgi:hypothetical protein
VARARELIEDSIIDFLPDKRAADRLLNELASSAGGNCHKRVAESCAVMQRTYGTNNFGWKQLLNFPSGWQRSFCDRLCRKDAVKKTIDNYSDCRLDIIAGDTKQPLRICDPYIIVSGKELKNVESIAGTVIETMNEIIEQNTGVPSMSTIMSATSDKSNTAQSAGCRMQFNGALFPNNRQNSGLSLKRNSMSDSGSLHEPPGKKPRRDINEKVCLLRIPSWLTEDASASLFRKFIIVLYLCYVFVGCLFTNSQLPCTIRSFDWARRIQNERH